MKRIFSKIWYCLSTESAALQEQFTRLRILLIAVCLIMAPHFPQTRIPAKGFLHYWSVFTGLWFFFFCAAFARSHCFCVIIASYRASYKSELWFCILYCKYAVLWLLLHRCLKTQRVPPMWRKLPGIFNAAFMKTINIMRYMANRWLKLRSKRMTVSGAKSDAW